RRNLAPAAPRDRDAEVAQARRGAGDWEAAPRRAGARRGHCPRARRSGRSAGQNSRGTPVTFDWRPTLKRRTRAAAVLFALWATVIEGKLAYLQVYRHGDLVARASRQQMRTIDAPAKRGDIVDRRGRVLATSVDADTIYAVPSEISDEPAVVAGLCNAFGDCTPKERQNLIERLGKQSAFAYIRRQVSPDVAARVAALDLD